MIQHGRAAALRSPDAEIPELGRSYCDALASYLAQADERALGNAYELGRRAILHRIGVLEIARIHHEALALLRPLGPGRPEALRRASEFLAEALSSYEMASLGFRDAIAALRHLNETMESEIQRIAHGVHDQAGQLLDAARLVMSGFSDDVPPHVRERLQQVGAILDQAEVELRLLSHELRPIVLDDLGLVAAVQFLGDCFAKRTGIDVVVDATLDRRAPSQIETAVYRIVQEALANVARHSQAAQVKIHLARRPENTLRCAIVDDGIGFDTDCTSSRADKGLGLVAIRERLNAVGGTLEIHSSREHGTELQFVIPLEQ
jgi:two-component system, NarL family, sensor histidine kinase UhpB